MKEVKLNIGGEKGNAFYILGLVRTLNKNAYDAIRNEMMEGDYNNLLRVFKKYFPFVELYSNYKLANVDEDLYIVDENTIEL